MQKTASYFKTNSKIYMIGIKGTGMCSFAEILHHNGINVSGSDTSDVFYTDAILKELGIPYYEDFNALHVPCDADAIVYSAAYNETNPELARANELNIPVLKYTDALGKYSALFDSSAIAGVHGKTTTTALTGTLLQALKLPCQVLAGSAVGNFGNTANGRCTLFLGNEYFVAETCEYRKHFLSFVPQRIVLTSIESDHQDYFPTYESIRDAFLEFVNKLPCGGELIYCADNSGAQEAACEIKNTRKDILLTPYGFNANGNFKIKNCHIENEHIFFELELFPGTVWKISVPGMHNVQNAAAAIALSYSLTKNKRGAFTESDVSAAAAALAAFKGSKRRQEVLGEVCDILFMDDYGHHPTAIKTTLRGLKDFYPKRRLVVSFMSHTYTRTAALLDEFAGSFESADVLLLHKIYASAREVYTGTVSGEKLFLKTKESSCAGKKIFFFEEPFSAFDMLKDFLQAGDLFVTIGAGDNWKLGRALYDNFCTNKGQNNL
ncbi:MAG: UDP-N-acetylmuramate--L-alanine ligase [Spirochaetaceae bacterium]|nr:UDP-N-acetylmuramate--L-alanine ligase [Spirochaetaceae bacterium]